MRYRSALAAILLAGAPLAAGCSSGSAGPGVPSLSSPAPSGASSPSGSAKDQALAYSQCMRAHGVKDFPDPNAQGQIQLELHPGSDLTPDSPRFQAAQQACKSLEPTGSPEQQASARANALKYATCMRGHGIKDFPDPSEQGGLQVSMSPGSDLDPNNPHYKAAAKACESMRPGGPGAPTSGSGS